MAEAFCIAAPIPQLPRLTELNIAFKNCVFYKNVGNVGYMQYNNTISLPTKSNNYLGKGRFVFVNNSLFGNYNSARTNTRSISIGDVKMEYYFINNLMNDNEKDDGTAQAETYGLVLEGGYSTAPANVIKMVTLGNVFNATGGAFSSVNYPDLDVSMNPDKKNVLGQKLMRTQQQTDLATSAIGVSYLYFTSSADSVSAALNNGVNEYLLDNVNIVPQTDILGNAISDLTRDAGVWEMQVNQTGIRQITKNSQIIYPNPFADVVNIKGSPERIEIYNIAGQCILKYDNPASSINVSELKSGSYIIKSVTDGNVMTQKAFKK
ncbi:MAG: T9SS type A sorting domain-containing protein [Paludibacteraceae bacterium]